MSLNRVGSSVNRNIRYKILWKALAFRVLFFSFGIYRGFMVKYVLDSTCMFYSGLFAVEYKINTFQGSDQRKVTDTDLF